VARHARTLHLALICGCANMYVRVDKSMTEMLLILKISPFFTLFHSLAGQFISNLQRVDETRLRPTFHLQIVRSLYNKPLNLLLPYYQSALFMRLATICMPNVLARDGFTLAKVGTTATENGVSSKRMIQ